MSTINSSNVQVGQSVTAANNITLSTSAGGDLVVNKGVFPALTEITRIKNNGEMDAAKVGYTPAGTGATATTVQSKLRESVSVKDFGAKGDGVTDDTAAIQAGIDHLATAGGTLVVPAGVYICRQITLKTNVFLVGQGKTVTTLKMKNSTNADFLLGLGSAALWGTDTFAGITNFGIGDLTIDGNRSNNTAGCCIAFYGSKPLLCHLNIINAPEHGVRSEWYSYGDAVSGMEGEFSDISIDSSGKHGWLFEGPHDSAFNDVIIIDASKAAHNTYDGMHISGNGNGRFRNIHPWTRSTSVAYQRHALYVANSSEFAECHFEGAYSSNTYIVSQRNAFVACNWYAAKNGKNIVVKSAQNHIHGNLGDKASGAIDCVGVTLGDDVADNAAGNIIDVICAGQNAGVVDFTNSKGNNQILIRGTSSAGTYIGAPTTTDAVDIKVSGASTFNLKQASSPYLFKYNVGIGYSIFDSTSLFINRGIGNSATAYGVQSVGQISSAVTSKAGYYQSYGNTEAATFTLGSLQHFIATQGTFGAGSTVSAQFGFLSENNLTGAALNYGFYAGDTSAVTSGKTTYAFFSKSNSASGGGTTYGLFMEGTAPHYINGNILLNKTITAGGTTGAQTINKNAGSVNFAAAATSLVVTNSLVNGGSLVIATVATNDATMKTVQVVCSSGFFTLYGNAAPTAETRVNFMLIN